MCSYANMHTISLKVSPRRHKYLLAARWPCFSTTNRAARLQKGWSGRFSRASHLRGQARRSGSTAGWSRHQIKITFLLVTTEGYFLFSNVIKFIFCYVASVHLLPPAPRTLSHGTSKEGRGTRGCTLRTLTAGSGSPAPCFSIVDGRNEERAIANFKISFLIFYVYFTLPTLDLPTSRSTFYKDLIMTHWAKSKPGVGIKKKCKIV